MYVNRCLYIWCTTVYYAELCRKYVCRFKVNTFLDYELRTKEDSKTFIYIHEGEENLFWNIKFKGIIFMGFECTIIKIITPFLHFQSCDRFFFYPFTVISHLSLTHFLKYRSTMYTRFFFCFFLLKTKSSIVVIPFPHLKFSFFCFKEKVYKAAWTELNI